MVAKNGGLNQNILCLQHMFLETRGLDETNISPLFYKAWCDLLDELRTECFQEVLVFASSGLYFP